MFSIGPRVSVKVTKANRTITVGNNSYISVSGDGTNPEVILTKGKENGHILVIECSLAQGFSMVDNIDHNKTELSKKYKMKGSDILTLIWSGTRWVEISFSKNS